MNEIKRNQRSKRVIKPTKNANPRSKTTKRTKKDLEFERYLEEIERPEYKDWEANYALPENPTSLEKAKYGICQKILAYQQDNNLSDKVVAKKIKLSIPETKEIFFAHIDKFTLDRLMTYAERLFAPSEVKITVEEKKNFVHARLR